MQAVATLPHVCGSDHESLKLFLVSSYYRFRLMISCFVGVKVFVMRVSVRVVRSVSVPCLTVKCGVAYIHKFIARQVTFPSI